ncbi:hypothetical protein JY486_09695 [Serratia marcescens]|nr:hypothetical protein [Serratia marcescens]MBH2808935.1 hypothetical protein [Serratia marcescens]MBN5234445.1 hypothetical protein [Serratia marcescens]
MRSFAARLPNLLLFLAFVAYPARNAAELPAGRRICLPMVQRLPCIVALAAPRTAVDRLIPRFHGRLPTLARILLRCLTGFRHSQFSGSLEAL